MSSLEGAAYWSLTWMFIQRLFGSAPSSVRARQVRAKNGSETCSQLRRPTATPKSYTLCRADAL